MQSFILGVWDVIWKLSYCIQSTKVVNFLFPFVGAKTAYHYILTKSPAYTNRIITRVTILTTSAKTFTLQQTHHAHAHSNLFGITYQTPFLPLLTIYKKYLVLGLTLVIFWEVSIILKFQKKCFIVPYNCTYMWCLDETLI